ncbi:MAG: glycosyltransferase family 2 protein [Chthoniobacterales bacterium]
MNTTPLSQLSVTVLIPAYNEVDALPETVAAVSAHAHLLANLEIIVINDGSSDGTAEVAARLPVRVINHETNHGYGASLKDGLREASHDWILIIDADGTYPIDQIPRLLEESDGYDMVVGARTGEIVQVPLLRRPAKWIITRLAEYLSQRKIPDLNSGLRLFRKEIAMKFFSLYPDGFSFTTTITLAMLTNRYRVKFLPINYLKRIGKSSIRPIHDFVNFTLLIIRICAYFKPLNVFIPPSSLLILLGLIKSVIDYNHQGHLGLLGVSLVLTGIQMLFIGLLADLVDQRMKM